MLPLTEAQQQALLRLARQVLEASVRERRLPEAEPPPDVPDIKCGAFVTLRKRGRLRGCIGFVEPLKPLNQAVREGAYAAALRDPRFEPVTPEELPSIELEISVLSPLVEISLEDIQVGVHGLMISQGVQRGLLLPQVAVEWKWDRRKFLEETCQKAGLPVDAWRHGARVQAFTAQIFSEAKVSHPSHPAA